MCFEHTLTNVLPIHVVVEGDTVVFGGNVVQRADQPGLVSFHSGPRGFNEHVITCRTRGKGVERQCAMSPALQVTEDADSLELICHVGFETKMQPGALLFSPCMGLLCSETSWPCF